MEIVFNIIVKYEYNLNSIILCYITIPDKYILLSILPSSILVCTYIMSLSVPVIAIGVNIGLSLNRDIFPFMKFGS